jgi:hypothetical protein
MPLLEKLARFAGARLVLREVTHPDEVKRGEELLLKMKWSNVGVGKLYYPYVLSLSLLGSDGRVGFAGDAKANVLDWVPGDYTVTESLRLPAGLNPGEYTLALSLADPAGHRPAFRLAIDLPETAGRYAVARIRIR